MTLLTLGLWIAGICVVLAIFSVIHQTIEQKRAERRRVIAGLERHAMHIQELMSGIPQGYLTRDLEAFLYDNILEVYEKLATLDPHSTYHETLEKYRNDKKILIESEHRIQKRAVFATLQEVKEMKQRLKDLLVLIASAVKNNTLNITQANQFKHYLSKAMLSINLNTFRLAALQAESANNLPIAIHYHEQAKKLLVTSSVTSNTMLENKPRIDEYDRLIKNLSDKLAAQTATLLAQNGEDVYKPRMIINDASDPSKKKQIYDQ